MAGLIYNTWLDYNTNEGRRNVYVKVDKKGVPTKVSNEVQIVWK